MTSLHIKPSMDVSWTIPPCVVGLIRAVSHTPTHYRRAIVSMVGGDPKDKSYVYIMRFLKTYPYRFL